MATRRQARPITALTALSMLLGGFYLTACSGAQPKPAEEPEPTPTEPLEPTTTPEPTEEPAASPGDEPTAEAPPKKATPAENDYDMTYRDCQALAGTYQRAWERSELEKLEDKNFKPKLHDTAVKNIQQAAAEAGNDWLSQCEGTVGTPYLYSRLKCALKAKTVDHFNDCLDGKTE